MRGLVQVRNREMGKGHSGGRHQSAMRLVRRRDLLAVGATALASVTMPRAGFAQSRYPERPIKLMVAFSAGGVNDAVARQWAERMKSLLGTVYVENQGAAPARSPAGKSPALPPTATRCCWAAPAPWCSTR